MAELEVGKMKMFSFWRDSECSRKKKNNSVEDSIASKEPRGRIERFMD